MAFEQDRPALLDLIERLYDDNDTEDVTPADLRAGLQAIVYSAALKNEATGSAFPADEAPTSTAIGNLPAGSVVAARPVADVLREAWSEIYKVPKFESFTLGGVGSVKVEVGTQYPAGDKVFAWTTSNTQNVQAANIEIFDMTSNTELASGEANDGQATVVTTGFTVTDGESRRYGIYASNTKNGGLERFLIITGAYKVFYGAADTVPGTSAQVRGLPNNRLSTDGNQFTLNTGATLKDFVLHLPPGRNLVSIIDLDALNKNITDEYLPSALMVNDVAGQPTPTAGTRYVKSQAVPYSTNHRHQITIS